ncbi:MAG: hypothetical protein WCO00_05385 [Rhodospirillaceae bacterium]
MGTCGTDSDDDLEYRPPTREEVFAQLEDWRRRLHALYTDIISWLPEGEGYETEIRDTLTDEGPMRMAGVPPQPVPELRVLRHGELMVTFTPDACWIIGVLGRVMVSNGSHRPHKLVEVDFPASKIGWRLYRSDWPSPSLQDPSSLLQPRDPRLLSGVRFDGDQLCGLVEISHG